MHIPQALSPDQEMSHFVEHMQLFSARVSISDCSYSRGGCTELISDTGTVVVVARNFFYRLQLQSGKRHGKTTSISIQTFPLRLCSLRSMIN